MQALRFLYLAGAALLIGTIVWAFASGAPFGASFSAIAAMPWGFVSLLDLYLGFFCFAAVVALVERERSRVVLVVAATFLLGNLVPALWLAWRGLEMLRDKPGRRG